MISEFEFFFLIKGVQFPFQIVEGIKFNLISENIHLCQLEL